jgi:uncharacterized protein HemX
MIKRILIGVIFLGLGVAFFLQKQQDKKQALELAKRQQELSQRRYASPSVAASVSQDLPRTLRSVPTAKPKPTPMLPKPTPMLRPSP